ncbi:urease accessory protein UreD [bacterium]|nr:urease accessory protein UreD [Bacteroidales bacterium]MBD5292174.1 urease accessory protein UreD [Bacteroides sp.]MBD5338684.1 urease accessory protein UreD [Bacteroides sp.]MBD5386198.1 urease accessory protein UreD [bacterium]MDE6806707.1 urease accessory protein UreD [Muribaculaceae bacterium]
MAFDYQSHLTTSDTGVPPVDFSHCSEMAPYLDTPLAMYVGAPGKHGYLRLGFEIDPRGKSILRDLDRRAPLIVQQALYFDKGMPEMPCVYILSSGGPNVEGDRYQQDITMNKGSYAWISTGAATKLAEMTHNYSGLVQHITLKEDSYLEFMPEPVYPCRHTRFISDTTITIDPTASLFYSEIFMGGRKYYKEGELFEFDILSVCSHAERPDGTPLFREKFIIDPKETNPRQLGIMGQYDVFSNVIVLAPKDKADEIYAQTNPFIDRENRVACGITHLPNDAGLLFKVLGMEPGPVKKIVRDFLATFRKVVKGKELPEEFPWR